MSFCADNIGDMGIVSLLEFCTRPFDGRDLVTTDLVKLAFGHTIAEEENSLGWYPRLLAIILDQIECDLLKVQNLWA